MRVPINYLQERYPLFAYSTLQKYKAEKEGEHFFSSKKDFYLFLEANYLLELKARKKLINIFDIKDIYFLSYINNVQEIFYENSIYNALLTKLQQLNKNHLKYELTKEKEEYSKWEIINNIENKLKLKNINYFDEWVLLEMVVNLQKYIKYVQSILITKMEHDKIKEEFELKKINKEICKLKVKNSYYQEQIFFLEKNKKNPKIIIKEKIEPQKKNSISKNTKKRELREPKWVNYSDEKIDLYLDHTFNFIKINYEKKYFQYNLLQIPIEWLF